MTRYVEAMQRRIIDERRIHQIVKDAVSVVLAQPNESARKKLAGGSAGEAAEELTQAALDKVDASIISVRTQTLPGSKGEVLAIPYDSDRSVHTMLDDIWFAISDVVPSYSYGKAWVIRDVATKRVFDVGRPWARRNGFGEDKRPLGEVGIEAGAQLEVVPTTSNPLGK